MGDAYRPLIVAGVLGQWARSGCVSVWLNKKTSTGSLSGRPPAVITVSVSWASGSTGRIDPFSPFSLSLAVTSFLVLRWGNGVASIVYNMNVALCQIGRAH